MARLNTGAALGGAGTGALYGTQMAGPVGGAIGGLLGGIGGLFGSGRRKPKRVSQFDPQQKQLYDQYFQALQTGGGPLADVFGQFDPQQARDVFNQAFAQPAYQNFQENIIPSITGQFRGQNLQNSSYLGGALSKAGTDVQKNIDAQLAKILYDAQQANIGRRQQGLQNLLGQRSFGFEKPQPSIFDSLLGSLAGGAGQLLANRFSPVSPGQTNPSYQAPFTNQNVPGVSTGSRVQPGVVLPIPTTRAGAGG